jgi:hypothetical protein
MGLDRSQSPEQPEETPLRDSRVTVNLTAAVHAELRRLAREEARSVSNLCQLIIEASIGRRKR